MRRVWILASALALAACSSGKPTATPSTSSPGTTATPTSSTSSAAIIGDWPVYHHDNGRSGVASDQGALGKVHHVWTSARLDELVYAQPLVVGNNVIIATSGAIVWQKNLGTPVSGGSLPCGNISPSGITGTPAIDPAAGIIYLVAYLRNGPHHELFALNLSNGGIRWHRTIDPPGLSPVVEQERGAVAFGNGRVYVPFGGLQGDCGPYKGAVVSSSAGGAGALQSYIVPTSREGGIWTPAGPVLDSSGSVWITTGNSASTGSFDFGNAVIRLSPALKLSDYFAPSNWAALNAGDVDLGSVAPVLLSDGRVLAAGKAGVAYLINRSNLAHVGGEITSRHVCSRAFGQPAALASMVFVACEDSLVAVRAGGRTLSVAWTSRGDSGPSIIAAGAVWTMKRDGTLIALNPSNGRTLYSTNLGTPATRFISPSAAGGRLFVADGNRIVAFALH